MVWEWFGDGLGMVWGWFGGSLGMVWGDGLGMVWGDGLGMVWVWFGDGLGVVWGWSGDGLGMVWGDGLGMVWGWFGGSLYLIIYIDLNGQKQPPAGNYFFNCPRLKHLLTVFNHYMFRLICITPKVT